jgi:hypothetical protein
MKTPLSLAPELWTRIFQEAVLVSRDAGENLVKLEKSRIVRSLPAVLILRLVCRSWNVSAPKFVSLRETILVLADDRTSSYVLRS